MALGPLFLRYDNLIFVISHTHAQKKEKGANPSDTHIFTRVHI